MKHSSFVSLAILSVMLMGSIASAQKIDSKVIRHFRNQSANQTKVRVIALMKSNHGDEMRPRRYHAEQVLPYLKELAKTNAREITDYLKQNHAGQEVRIRQVLFINNSLVAEVTLEGLKLLSKAPNISKIYENGRVSVEPGKNTSRPQFADKYGPYQVGHTHLDQLIKEMPEVTGKGVLLGHVDSGIEATHSSLQGKVKFFLDAKTGKTTEPSDDETGHGTHTAGTMVGGDHSDQPWGVAPGATLVSSGHLTDYETILKQMQYMTEADHRPRAVNNSWGCSDHKCDEEVFNRAVDAWDALGITAIFAAGNFGKPNTIWAPNSHPAAITVAASGHDGKIAPFSSRGPGDFRGKPAHKPDVTAPGIDIKSCSGSSGFAFNSGTSMAAPQVTGAVALVLQVAPKLNPTQIRQVLIQSARPLDEKGNPAAAGEWNATYGFGMLDIYAAVKLAQKTMNSSDRGSLFLSENRSAEEWISSPGDLQVQAILSQDENTEWSGFQDSLQ